MSKSPVYQNHWEIQNADLQRSRDELDALRKKYKQQQRMMSQVFEHIGEAIVITDCNNRIIATNSTFTRMTGYSREEALGKDPKMLKSGRESVEFYQAMWDSLKIRDYWQGEIWDKRKDGSFYPKLLSITVVRDSTGEIVNYIGGFYDITAQIEAEQAIERLAHHDTLTTLPNRFSFTDRLSQELERAKRTHEGLAVMFIDLDHFKNINDSLGHHIGDKLLCEVASRLKAVIRNSDIVARLGGDEFVIALTNIEESFNAAHVADKIISSFAKEFLVDGHELHSTPSIGISIFPENGSSIEDLLKNADMAMYHAKSQGRNNYQYFTREMQNAALERLAMERDLRLALERDEFFVHYQPQVNLVTGQMVGIEALVRWRHPERGIVMPGSFIPLAEETGLIEMIGEWVLRTACRQNKSWQDAGYSPLTMAVNLSARQLTQIDIGDLVSEVLLESGLDPRYLELEITESLVMNNVEEVMATLNELKSMGMHLAMDDFGTGYSSLSYLTRFPFDKLKIDQSFVRDITSNPDNASIARAVIALAHALRLKVIAEGVETEAQLNYLRIHGCDEIQGYFFSYPLPADEFEQLLREDHHLQPANILDNSSDRTLLVVDDDMDVALALQRMLYLDGYNVLIAESALEAFELLANNRVSVVISDQRMPVMTGTEFLSRVKELYPEVVRILLTGYADLNSVSEAVNRGAIYKFLNKPWKNEALRNTVDEAFKYYELMADRLRNT